MTGFGQDIQYGLRMLGKNPGFTAVAILTLAVGIGATSAMFSVVNSVLLQPLPFGEPDRAVLLWESLPQGGTGTVSTPNFADWRAQNEVFEAIAGFTPADYSFTASEQPERVAGARVTADFFRVMNLSPLMGRTFIEGEDQPGRDGVAVISEALWRRSLGADPKIIGKTVLLNGEAVTVIGVMPAGYNFPFGTRGTAVWRPLVFSEEQKQNRGSHWMFTIARLKQGVTAEQAQEQMKLIAKRLEQQYPDQQAQRSVVVVPLHESIVGWVRPALLMLFGAVAFLLLIACTNVANLLLARAASRRREIAIRHAMGAGRGRIVRQLLTESVMLAVAGGVLGLVLATWGVTLLVKTAASLLPRAAEVGVDWRVAAFTFAVAVATGILFGIAPALHGSRSEIQDALKEGATSVISGRANRLRNLLAVTEVAAALVLLIGAGLMIKSFMRMQQVDFGFAVDNVLTARLSLPSTKYDTPEKIAAFYDQLLSRLSSAPGVQSAGVINALPVDAAGMNGTINVEGKPPADASAPLVEFRVGSLGYFRALDVPLVRGRFFEPGDMRPNANVLVINQTLAKTFFANEDPVGKRIQAAGQQWFTVIGVVGDARQAGLTAPARPEIVVPYTQFPTALSRGSLAVRGHVDAASLTTAVRNAVHGVDPAQPIYGVQTMRALVDQSFSNSRLNTLLLGIFAGIATTLALIGIYSVMSYLVLQHTREIGIRMALGAQRIHVLRMVLQQGLLVTGIGLAAGVAGAIGLTRLMRGMLFGVTPTDPLTFAAVTVMLLGVALLACFVPARRATQVDPMVALRYE